MAKKTYQIVMMVPEENPSSQFRYYAKKTTKGMKASEKMRVRKHNKLTNKHEWFVEKKLPSHSKK